MQYGAETVLLCKDMHGPPWPPANNSSLFSFWLLRSFLPMLPCLTVSVTLTLTFPLLLAFALTLSVLLQVEVKSELQSILGTQGDCIYFLHKFFTFPPSSPELCETENTFSNTMEEFSNNLS